MIKNTLLEAFNKLEIETQNLNDETTLHNELGMDSQEIIELHFYIEKLFNVKLPEKFISNTETIGSLTNKLATQLAAS